MTDEPADWPVQYYEPTPSAPPPRLVTIPVLRAGLKRLMAAYPKVGYADWEWPPRANRAAWQVLKDRWLDCLEDMTDTEFLQAIDDHLAGAYASTVAFPAYLLAARDERRGRDMTHVVPDPPSGPSPSVAIPAPAPVPPPPDEPNEAAQQEADAHVAGWAAQAQEAIRQAAAKKPKR